MVELTEIPLELQLQEADRRIKLHESKRHKFPEFLSPMFLWRFPAVMDNQISVDWDTITGVFDRTLFLPITLIDTEILDDHVGGGAHPAALLAGARNGSVYIAVQLPGPAGYHV